MPPSAHADELEVSGPLDDGDGGSGGGGESLFFDFGDSDFGGGACLFLLGVFSVVVDLFSSFAVPLPSSRDPLGNASVLVAEEEGQRAREGRVG